MSALVISTGRLVISVPRIEHAAAMLAFVERNREHLKPWNPPEPEGLYTLAHWQAVVAKCASAFDATNAVRFWMAASGEPNRVIGSIGYSQISCGPFWSCVLGYQIDHECEGQGLMSEALRATNRYMF